MSSPSWQANGLLFENCSCQLLCPAHLSFKQTCDGDRCRGHWVFHLDSGHYSGTALRDTNIAVVFDAPTTMYDGDWTQVFYIDERATRPQRQALEAIFSGQAGGPWAILNRFVSKQLESRVVPMQFEDQGRKKRLTIPNLFDTTVDAIRGANRDDDAILANLHNVIHGPVHTMARGSSRHTDRELGFEINGTHALYSYFSWKVDN